MLYCESSSVCVYAYIEFTRKTPLSCSVLIGRSAQRDPSALRAQKYHERLCCVRESRIVSMGSGVTLRNTLSIESCMQMAHCNVGNFANRARCNIISYSYSFEFFFCSPPPPALKLPPSDTTTISGRLGDGITLFGSTNRVDVRSKSKRTSFLPVRSRNNLANFERGRIFWSRLWPNVRGPKPAKLLGPPPSRRIPSRVHACKKSATGAAGATVWALALNLTK